MESSKFEDIIPDEMKAAWVVRVRGDFCEMHEAYFVREVEPCPMCYEQCVKYGGGKGGW